MITNMDSNCPFTAPSHISSKVYVTGIKRGLDEKEVASHFSICGNVVEVVFPVHPTLQTRLGYALVTFERKCDAQNAVQTLHYTFLKGKAISVKFDVGVTQRGGGIKYAVSRQVIDDGDSSCKAFYTGRSLTLSNGKDYPIPQGTYLLQLLRRFHSLRRPLVHQKLFDILVEDRTGVSNKQSKELSESMAMVNAIMRTGHLIGIDIQKRSEVQVFAVADGVLPMTSAALGLFMPDTWIYYTIDPLLEYDSSCLDEQACARMHMIKSRTDEFDIPSYASSEMLSIVIACHSHAPLQEFWSRVQEPKIAIVMPCCGKAWSDLSDVPIDIYEDFEVLSPKRKIFLYSTSTELLLAS